MPELTASSPISAEISTSDKPIGTKTIAENGLHDVSIYQYAKVAVPEPEGNIELTHNEQTYDVADKATATVNLPLQTLTVHPSINDILISPTQSYEGLKKVLMKAVTAAIDSNIQPENIRKDVSILGKTGSLVTPLPTAAKKKINFYDYDGKLLYSFDAWQQNQTLPDLPYHDGLICQGWNYSTAEIYQCFQYCGRCNIGATYITDDDSTRLYMSFPNDINLSPTLYLQLSDGSLTIDWGDDTTPDTISEAGSSYVNIIQGHTYAVAGDYVISLLFSGEGGYILGQGTTATTVLGDYGSIYTNFLLKAEIGADCALSANVFRQYLSLRYVILTKGITALPNRVFWLCYSLRCLILPNVVDSIETAALQMTYSLSVLSLPPSLTDIQNIGLSTMYSLTDVIIPVGLKTIGSSALTTCKGLTYVALPQSVTSVGASAFSDCANLKILDLTDFTDPAAVPTLANTNAFSGTALTEIWVSSAEMKAAFSATTNWSSFAGLFMIKIPS